MKFYAMYSNYGRVAGTMGKQLHVFFNRRERNQWIESDEFVNGNYHRFPANDYLIADYRKQGNRIDYIEHKDGKTYHVNRVYDWEYTQQLDNETGEPLDVYGRRAY